MSDTNNSSELQQKLDLLKQRDDRDIIYNALKASGSAIPLISPIVGYFYETDIKEPSTKRLHDFLDELVQKLLILEQQIDAVSFDNPTFQTTFKKAIRIAECEHQQEKLEALRNAVLNSATPNCPRDDIQAIFLKWIDELTVSHIKLLRMLHYIDDYNEAKVVADFPDLEENRSFYNQILKELSGKGLIKLREVYKNFKEKTSLSTLSFDQGIIPTPEIGSSLANQREETGLKTVKHTEDIDSIISNVKYNLQKSITTELGKQFIQFIENPLI